MLGRVKRGQMDLAVQLLHRLRTAKSPQLSDECYNIVLWGFTRSNQMSDALRMFQLMQRDGIEIGAASYNHLARLFAKNKRWGEALLLVDMMLAEKIPLDTKTRQVLVRSKYMRSENMAAFSLFDQTRQSLRAVIKLSDVRFMLKTLPVRMAARLHRSLEADKRLWGNDQVHRTMLARYVSVRDREAARELFLRLLDDERVPKSWRLFRMVLRMDLTPPLDVPEVADRVAETLELMIAHRAMIPKREVSFLLRRGMRLLKEEMEGHVSYLAGREDGAAAPAEPAGDAEAGLQAVDQCWNSLEQTYDALFPTPREYSAARFLQGRALRPGRACRPRRGRGGRRGGGARWGG